MDANVENELNGVLRWAYGMRELMDRDPDRAAEVQMQGHAYIGGVLTTLDHLGLVSEDEHRAWWDRLNGVLGDPPGGWVGG